MPFLMFEGKTPIAPGANSSERGKTVAEELCALEWGDLVTKLAAARDLRRELAATDASTLASFDADCAQHLAAHHDNPPQPFPHEKGKHGVNPDDLANGKAPAAIQDGVADRDDPANRGCT